VVESISTWVRAGTQNWRVGGAIVALPRETCWLLIRYLGVTGPALGCACGNNPIPQCVGAIYQLRFAFNTPVVLGPIVTLVKRLTAHKVPVISRTLGGVHENSLNHLRYWTYFFISTSWCLAFSTQTGIVKGTIVATLPSKRPAVWCQCQPRDISARLACRNEDNPATSSGLKVY
jgi:hypothetical protein